MKVLFTSDWHLDHVTDGHARFDEVAAAIDHSVKVAIEEKVAIYVFAGDLSDPDGFAVHRAQAKAQQVATRLKNAGIRVIFVAGNHDVVEDGFGTTVLSPIAASEACDVFEQPGCIQFSADRYFVALPFTPRSHTYEPAAFIRQIASKMPAKARQSSNIIVVGHLGLAGINPGSETNEMPRGREVLWPLDELKKWFPRATLVGGHYHKAQEYKGVNIIGNLARLTHGEEKHEPSMLLLEQ
jgi:DNA repair exonuclease SbcCD nuclease subunit